MKDQDCWEAHLREHDLAREADKTLAEELERRHEQRFQMGQDAVAQALAASDKATAVAEVNAQRWRDQANEWRGAMDDLANRLVQRREFEQNNASVMDRLTKLEKQADLNAGQRIGVGALVASLATAVTIIIGVVLAANAIFS